jgi:D-alanyl-D-alanine endopeptidase (penicillin-binding protein 7)
MGAIVVLAAVTFALPSTAAAAPYKSAKKKPAAVSKPVRSKRVARAQPARPTFGQLAGLRATEDSLDLKSSVALVMDQDTDEVLFSKNPNAVLPIASITKLMTAMVVTDAGLPLGETLTVTQDDVDTEKGSRSRLRVGTQLNREEMLHLALMASENRAAHALGRHYPGGLDAFVSAMNAKAALLGMHDTHYVEPTGLSSLNQSSARDLATLVKAAYEVELIRTLSTSPEYAVEVNRRTMQFRNTNRLVRNSSWDIGLQKTGYISEAGRCLVMQATLAGRQLIMVFLDSTGKYSRLGDAERVRRWVNEFAAVSPTTLDTTLGATLDTTLDAAEAAAEAH